MIFALIFIPFTFVALSEIDVKRAGLWIGLGCLSMPIELGVAFAKYGTIN